MSYSIGDIVLVQCPTLLSLYMNVLPSEAVKGFEILEQREGVLFRSGRITNCEIFKVRACNGHEVELSKLDIRCKKNMSKYIEGDIVNIKPYVVKWSCGFTEDDMVGCTVISVNPMTIMVRSQRGIEFDVTPEDIEPRDLKPVSKIELG